VRLDEVGPRLQRIAATPSRFKATLYSRALLRPLAVNVGQAEGLHPITAFAHDQIKPPAVRMNASLQRFNLVRIECHFNVPVPLTTYRHRYIAREGRANLPLFRQKSGRRSAIFGEVRPRKYS